MKTIKVQTLAGINKRKIINDPVYGFVTIPGELIFDIIEHPWFQRLRRIKQLGLTHLVYPGALHTRFPHALGVIHLMKQAVETLRLKGHEITALEETGVTLAGLLHDIGHGPFSHALEHSIVRGMNHEELSLLYMNLLNEEFHGALDTAISIFKNEYAKKFLHQLVSGQLDMDRMDYLKRDSFFTGVAEGVISSDRILHMLNVKNDELVVEAKGIYSVEKFIVARRLMYWQVYYHKTVLSAEQILIHILKRARWLATRGEKLFAPPQLLMFLENDFTKSDFLSRRELSELFGQLDDADIFTSIKVWVAHPDKILSTLSRALVNRNLFHIEISPEPFPEETIQSLFDKTAHHLGLSREETHYFFYQDEIANNAYNPSKDIIYLLSKDGTIQDIASSSAQINVSLLKETVTNYYLCYPKGIL